MYDNLLTVSDAPRRTVPTRQQRSVASIADRLRDAFVDTLDGWVASVPDGNGDGSRESRTDREVHTRNGASAATATRERRLPNVPDPYRDTALDVLAHSWSRYVFYYVRDRAHRSVSVSALTDDLLDWVPESEDVTRSDVAKALWEHHIPALAAQGLLEVDREAGTVRYVERCGIEEALDAQAQWDPNELLSGD